jgi:hypothetical protein
MELEFHPAPPRKLSYSFFCPKISFFPFYKGADKSLVRPTSRCILFHGENISFVASLVIQGVPGGTDNTSGGCSLGQTIPI